MAEAAAARIRGGRRWLGTAALAGLALLPMALPSPAQAPGRQLFGNRDFELEWRIEPAGRLIRARFLAGRRLLRLEALDGSGEAMIRDLVGGGVIVLVDEGRKGVYAAQGRPAQAFSGQPEERIREIAGENCRDFLAGASRFCLSDDGIPLVVEEDGQVLQALRLVRQAQNAALFQAPKDAKPRPMPGGAALTKLPF